MMPRPGFRRAGLVPRFELNERIDLRGINSADQGPSLVNSAAQIRHEIWTGSIDPCGKDGHDADWHGTAHGRKRPPSSMSGFSIVRRKLNRPRHRFAYELNRMAAVEPIDGLGGSEGNLEIAAAISASGAAEMHVSVHTAPLSSITAPLLPSIRARISRGNARIRTPWGNVNG